MYLYFDRKGILKEVVNDKALRQGNINVNKIYIFIEDLDTTIPQSMWVSYRLPDGTPTPRYDFSFTSISDANKIEIPYNPRRDLKFFKYYKKYPMYEIPTNDGDEQEDYIWNALAQPGNVACTIGIVNNEQIDTLGLIVFNVEESTDGTPEIHYDQYVSLAQFQYLLSEIGNKYTPAQILDLLSYYYTKIESDARYTKLEDILPSFSIVPAGPLMEEFMEEKGFGGKPVIIKYGGMPYIGMISHDGSHSVEFEFQRLGSANHYYGRFVDSTNLRFGDIISNTYMNNFATVSYVIEQLATKQDTLVLGTGLAFINGELTCTITGFSIDIVSSLPPVGSNGVLYLLEIESEEETNQYEEYLWIESENRYEFIGSFSTDIDLSNYYTKSESDARYGRLASNNTWSGNNDFRNGITITESDGEYTTINGDGNIEIINENDDKELGFSFRLNKQNGSYYIATEDYVDSAISNVLTYNEALAILTGGN